MQSYGIQISSMHPGARSNPVTSIPLLRPAHTVLGWTAEQIATFSLARDRTNLAAAEENFAAARAALGAANRMRGNRRYWQAKAMRNLNMRRASLRQARAALAVSLAAAPAALAS